MNYYYKNGVYSYHEVDYNFPNILCSELEYVYNENFGVLDLETFGSSAGGMGSQSVYAGGWATNKNTELFYLEENEDSVSLLIKIVDSIFLHNKDKYTFYAHNLGRFDGVFIIKSLVKDNKYKIKPIWKDNKLISMRIINIENKKVLNY